MMARSLLRLVALFAVVDGLRVTAVTRRTIIGTSGLAVASGFSKPAAASKFPQHVEDLDKAAAARDIGATRAALKILGLPDDEVSAATAISPTGDISKLRPKVQNVQSALTSFKVTIAAPPAESDYEVKIMWLRNPVGGGLVAVREFKAKGGVREAASLAASVPKALGVSRVVPCVFSERHGVVVGDEITLTD